MASGRVGGTKSKVSGQIGSEIYQIVRNDDGTYSQVVMAKGVKTVITVTERGRAQQMCTAMIESLMAELKAIGSVSFQSGANKSKSLNAFSSFNLRRVADDCKANWYSGNRFFYPTARATKNPGGLYMLSSGTLQREMYDKLVTYYDNPDDVPPIYPYAYTFIGLRVNIPRSVQTIGDLLRVKQWTRRDSMHFVFCHERIQWKEEGESKIVREGHDYISVQLAANLSDNTPVSAESLQALFGITASFDYYYLYDEQDSAVWIGYNDSDAIVDPNFTDRIFFYGAFSIMYGSGKKQVSSHNMVTQGSESEGYLEGNAPTNVFSTWMGQSYGQPWPSPFIQQNK